jgi:hypothetical protein
VDRVGCWMSAALMRVLQIPGASSLLVAMACVDGRARGGFTAVKGRSAAGPLGACLDQL